MRVKLLFTAALLSLLPLWTHAQYASGGTRLADIEQEVLLLKSQLGELRLAVEALQRENKALKQGIQAQAQSSSYVTLQQLNASLQALRADLVASDAQNRKQVLEDVSRQIEALAEQTQQALQSLAGAMQATPQAPAPAFQFSDNFPKTGVAYTVKSGDTLSGIAKKFNANIRDIQNANKIADPRSLQAGQTLFIPQANQ